MNRFMLVPLAVAVLAGPVLAQDAPPGSWAELPTDEAGDNHGIGGLNGSIYRFGGNTGLSGMAMTRAFSVGTSQWTAKANIPEVARRFSTVVVGESIYLVGVPGNATSRIYRYTPASNSWSTAGDLTPPCWGVATAAWHDKIVVIGGVPLARANDGDGFTAVRTVELFDPATGTFSSLPNLRRGVAMAAAGVLNDCVYVAGGVTSILTGPSVADTWMLDIMAGGAWQQQTPIPDTRFAAASFTLNDRLYVVGGGTWAAGQIGWDGYVSTACEFDPWANLWTERAPLPGTPRGWSAGCSLDGKGYVHGGLRAGSVAVRDFASYTAGPANVSMSGLAQRTEEGEPLARGTVLEPRSTVVLAATVTDTVEGNRSEVEFDVLSSAGRLSMRTGRAPNGEGRMLISGAPGIWRWRARPVNEFGGTGPWVVFGGGEFTPRTGDPDFTILAPPTPPPPPEEIGGGPKSKGCPLAAGVGSFAWILLPLVAFGLRRR